MDFQIKTQTFLNFISKCKLGDLVKDLYLQILENKLFVRFSDNHGSMYCEVLEGQVKITKSGNILIASLDKLISVVSRLTSDVIRVVSDDQTILISDGSNPGKAKIKLTQLGSVDYLESFQRIKDTPDILDRDNLTYGRGKIQLQNGFEISLEVLQELIKDAKAFGFEIYKFFEKDGVLNCSIEDKSLGESFNRKLITESKFGQEIKEVTLGVGFKEVLNAINKEKSEEKQSSKTKSVKIFFDSAVVLITDGNSFFYNIHSVVADKN